MHGVVPQKAGAGGMSSGVDWSAFASEAHCPRSFVFFSSCWLIHMLAFTSKAGLLPLHGAAASDPSDLACLHCSKMFVIVCLIGTSWPGGTISFVTPALPVLHCSV